MVAQAALTFKKSFNLWPFFIGWLVVQVLEGGAETMVRKAIGAGELFVDLTDLVL